MIDVQTAFDARSAAQVAREMEQSFTKTGENIGLQLAQSLMSGFKGANFSSISGALSTSSMIGEAGAAGTAMGAALAAGVGAAAVAGLASAALQIGSAFEEINRDVTMHTAATGQALDDLKTRADNLVGSLDTAAGAIGGDMATLGTRLQMTAGPALDQLTRHVEELRDRWGELNTSALAGAFLQFNVSAGDADQTLASLNQTALSSATNLNTLVRDLATYASTLAEANLNAEQAGHFLAEIEAKGIPASKAVTGLEAAMKGAAKQGQDLSTFLQNVSDSIDYYRQHNNDAAADAIALDVFGTRRWAEAKAIIDDYTRTVRSGADAYRAPSQAIDEMTEKTKTLGNEWSQFTNQLSTTFRPVGEAAVWAVTAAVHGLHDALGGVMMDVNMLSQAWQWLQDHNPFAVANPQVPHGNIAGGGGPGAQAERRGTPMGSPGSPPFTPESLGPGGGAGGSTASNALGGSALDHPSVGQYGFNAEPKTPKAPKAPGIPEAQAPYSPDYYGAPAPGESAAQYSAQTAYLESQHRVAEAQLRLTQVQQDSTHTAEDLVKARNDLAKAERDEYQAQLRLTDATTKASESSVKAASSLTDIGAGLDKDFGLSRGLPGLADNLVRFLGSLALAGPMAQLSAQSAAQGGIGATGSGLMGMLGAQGAFGPQFTQPSGQSSSGADSLSYNTNLGSLSSRADFTTGGSRVAALYAVANSLQGTPYSQQIRNDCSGMVNQLAAAAVGLPAPPAGSRFNTTNEGDWLMSHGFQPGVGPPGSFRVGWNPLPGNAGHTAATLPGGENAESGGSHGNFLVGPGAAGANSPQFPLHAYLPMQQYDSGGPLMPGTTIAQNNTGKPEVVLPPPPQAPNIAASGPTGQTPGGIGSAAHSTAGIGSGATAIGGSQAKPVPGGGASAGAGGGLMGAATAAASTAADMFAPGSGQAVQVASQLMQRTIKLGGQLAGVGVGGLMETFLPTGASDLANNSWLTRIGGAFAGASPQLPNMAGKPQTPVPDQVPAQAPPLGAAAHAATGPPQVIQNFTMNGVGDVTHTTADSFVGDIGRAAQAAMPALGGSR